MSGSGPEGRGERGIREEEANGEGEAGGESAAIGLKGAELTTGDPPTPTLPSEEEGNALLDLSLRVEEEERGIPDISIRQIQLSQNTKSQFQVNEEH